MNDYRPPTAPWKSGAFSAAASRARGFSPYGTASIRKTPAAEQYGHDSGVDASCARTGFIRM